MIVSCFPADKTVQVSTVLRQYKHIYRVAGCAENAAAAIRAIVKLRHIGVLVSSDPVGPYTPLMCSQYAESRTVPAEICQTIVKEGGISEETVVLDIGSGTGSIAVELGMVSTRVKAADISASFLEIVRSRALSSGSHVECIRLDGNKLLFDTHSYDAL